MIMKASHRAVMVCSESLWFFKNNLFELFFELFGGSPNKFIHVINYTLQGVIIIKIDNLTSVQSVKVVQKYFGSCLIKYRTSFIFNFFLYQNYLCALICLWSYNNYQFFPPPPWNRRSSELTPKAPFLPSQTSWTRRLSRATKSRGRVTTSSPRSSIWTWWTCGSRRETRTLSWCPEG